MARVLWAGKFFASIGFFVIFSCVLALFSVYNNCDLTQCLTQGAKLSKVKGQAPLSAMIQTHYYGGDLEITADQWKKQGRKPSSPEQYIRQIPVHKYPSSKVKPHKTPERKKAKLFHVETQPMLTPSLTKAKAKVDKPKQNLRGPPGAKQPISGVSSAKIRPKKLSVQANQLHVKKYPIQSAESRIPVQQRSSTSLATIHKKQHQADRTEKAALIRKPADFQSIRNKNTDLNELNEQFLRHQKFAPTKPPKLTLKKKLKGKTLQKTRRITSAKNPKNKKVNVKPQLKSRSKNQTIVPEKKEQNGQRIQKNRSVKTKPIPAISEVIPNRPHLTQIDASRTVHIRKDKGESHSGKKTGYRITPSTRKQLNQTENKPHKKQDSKRPQPKPATQKLQPKSSRNRPQPKQQPESNQAGKQSQQKRVRKRSQQSPTTNKLQSRKRPQPKQRPESKQAGQQSQPPQAKKQPQPKLIQKTLKLHTVSPTQLRSQKQEMTFTIE